ncbi:HU family DNA-binding protein [Albimonas sp. CAU 1670]|uniref:HU family DNA-binding protein n=1 Tax=Albimonas sp. CAU 1670 TaxID=3032599 RepID=UPI0023D9BE47|nr:HU family DNA-binding protein [Albimonas sp. CAU 1670]MDF2231059.1 HU family DNA-binding protein [Albimonas sp. CAU 1670]
MKKDELVTALAEASGETKAAVTAVLGALNGVSESALKDGKSVTLPGIGKLEAVEKPAREVRNPQTGEKKMAEAHTAPKFKFSTTFKSAIRG